MSTFFAYAISLIVLSAFVMVSLVIRDLLGRDRRPQVTVEQADAEAEFLTRQSMHL